jgi:hypothetical protein
MIKKNLMVKNLQYAAEAALKHGRVAEAFLIAQMGGPGMLADIQERYFAQQKDPFISLILKPLFHKNYESIVSAEGAHEQQLN